MTMLFGYVFISGFSLPSDDDINIMMVGDILLHTPVEEAAANPDGSYNFDFIFENLKDEIKDAERQHHEAQD